MIAPKLLSDALVTKLRSIATLVEELGGDPEKIRAYEDQFPDSTSTFKAVSRMKERELMVVWNGTTKGTAQGRAVWLHRFSLIAVRVTFSAVWNAVANGPMADDSRGLRYVEVYAGCYPLFADISAERKTLFLDEQSTLDYLEMPLTLTERSGL